MSLAREMKLMSRDRMFCKATKVLALLEFHHVLRNMTSSYVEKSQARFIAFSILYWQSLITMVLLLNPSFTKPFGTHTFYQGGGGGGGGGGGEPPAILKTVAPMSVKFCMVLRTPLNVPEMLKLFT